MSWQVYLAGENHSAWRDDVSSISRDRHLPIKFVSPNHNFLSADEAASTVEDGQFWYNFKSARLNQARNQVLLEKSDIVVVRFGEHYRQLNSAFDAGFAVAHGKPLISLHDLVLGCELKEIDAAATAVATDVEQVVNSLSFICTGYTD
jgi:YtoQ family protein